MSKKTSASEVKTVQDAFDITENQATLLVEECGVVGIHDLPYATFRKVARVSRKKYEQFKSILHLYEQSLVAELKNEDIALNFKTARDYLSLRLRKREEEVFACMFLDSKRHLIKYEEIFVGSINSINIYPRTIIKRALHLNAAAIIVAHNHPSGCSSPSQSDKQMTQELKHSLGLVDICLLDHFVIGDEITSFVEEDLL